MSRMFAKLRTGGKLWGSARRRMSTFHQSLPLKHVLTITSLQQGQVDTIVNAAREVKQNPMEYKSRMSNETLLMLFSKPSLRTRLSFEAGMTQMGGHAIYYPLDGNATLGEKESIEDFAKVVSRYCTVVMARLASRETIREIAEHATVPVINALDDWAHPCQILADFQTMLEQPGVESLEGRKLSFVGDVHNNVTYDLMRGAALMGMHVSVAGPINEAGYEVEQAVLDEVDQLAQATGSKVVVTDDPVEAVKHADFVYADSTMSYGIAKELAAQREQMFSKYQITEGLMGHASAEAKFMHCLPATRGAEATAGVLDGPQSVIFDQAENRLHAQKALMLFLRDKL